MEPQERQSAVDDALTQIVNDFGRRISDEPVRLRNLLVDATGANAMVLKTEIDAVVAAAASDVPSTLLQHDETIRAEATQRLEETLGDQSDLAPWATYSWYTALNGGKANPQRPGEAAGNDATVAAVSDQGATVVGGPDATMLPPADGATVLPSMDGATVLPPVDGATVISQPAPGSAAATDGKQGGVNPLIFVGVGLAALVLVIFLVTRGGGDDPSTDLATGTPSTSTDGGGDTESPTPTGDQQAVGDIGSALTSTADFTVAPNVSGERLMTAEAGRTAVTLTFNNASNNQFNGHWIEAMPSVIGTSSPKYDFATTDLGDDVFGFAIDLAAGETRTFTYAADWSPADQSELDSVNRGYANSQTSWFDVNGDPRSPSFTVDSELTQNASGAWLIEGTTQPGNTVRFDGSLVSVDGNGNYTGEPNFGPGLNTIEIQVTSVLGVTHSEPHQWDFGSPEPTATSVPAATPVPTNQAPVLVCADEGYIVQEGIADTYYFWVSFDCFSDDSSNFVVHASEGEGRPGECGENNACWLYTVNPEWDGTPSEVEVLIWAVDDEGLESEASVVTMCFNC